MEYNVVSVATCKWLLKNGEDVRTIARTAYGDPNKYRSVLEANPFKWEPGMRIVVPNTPGLLTNKHDGEGDLSVIRRMLPETDPVKYLQTMFDWNGKDIDAGGYVYLPRGL